jgi:hypothetical protein
METLVNGRLTGGIKMNANNIICLASYRAVTGLQPQPIRLVHTTPAQVIRFEKAWAEKKNGRR